MFSRIAKVASNQVSQSPERHLEEGEPSFVCFLGKAAAAEEAAESMINLLNLSPFLFPSLFLTRRARTVARPRRVRFMAV